MLYSRDLNRYRNILQVSLLYSPTISFYYPPLSGRNLCVHLSLLNLRLLHSLSALNRSLWKNGAESAAKCIDH